MNDELFPRFDETTAPEGAREALAATRRGFGMIPNLERVMAGAPALLRSYSAAWDAFDETSLTPVERQVVYQTANYEDECLYCVPWHTLLSKQAGMLPEDIAALRDGGPLSDGRLEALRGFTRCLLTQRGKAGPKDLEAFLAAGYTPQNALEVVLGVAIKVMSNFTNSIAGTPLDAAVAPYRWAKPRIGMREDGADG